MRINPFNRSTSQASSSDPQPASPRYEVRRGPAGLLDRLMQRRHGDEAANSGLQRSIAHNDGASAAHYHHEGADPNAPARDRPSNVLPGSLSPPRGPTAMHLAAGPGVDSSHIRMLMNPGPAGGLRGNPNVPLPASRLHTETPAVRGDTPLHVAARSGNEGVVAALLEHPHVNVEAANAHGARPIDLAHSRLARPQRMPSPERAAAESVLNRLNNFHPGHGSQETGVIDHPAQPADVLPPPYGSPPEQRNAVAPADATHRPASPESGRHSEEPIEVAGRNGGYVPEWARRNAAQPHHDEKDPGTAASS